MGGRGGIARQKATIRYRRLTFGALWLVMVGKVRYDIPDITGRRGPFQMNAMLEIKHYSKSYGGDRKAADDVSLSVMGGDIYGFIGHNGAGKTAAIRCAAGILPFEGGKIWSNGTDIRKDPLLVKRQTADLQDNPDLYDNRSGKAYLNFIADVFEDRWKEKNLLQTGW